MGPKKIVHDFQYDLRYDQNVITKVGFFSRTEKGGDRTGYLVNVEFAKPQEDAVGYSVKSSYMLTINASMLPKIVVGHKWTKKSLTQNRTLKRKSGTFELKVVESNHYSKYLSKILDLKDLPFREFQDKYQNIGITWAMKFSKCFKLEVTSSNIDNIDFLIIPCYEVVRFLFLKTDKLTQIALNGNYDSSGVKQYFEKGRIMELMQEDIIAFQTNKSYSDIENITFAKVLGDVEIGKAFNRISNSFKWDIMNGKGAHLEIDTIYPKSYSKVHVCGRQLNFNNVSYFYVYQIYSVDYKLPFSYFMALPLIDTRSGNEVENEEVKNYKRIAIKPSDSIKEVILSDSKEGNPLSVESDLYFGIEQEDVFENELAAERIIEDKEIQQNKYKGTTKTFYSSSGNFTLDKSNKKGSDNLKASLSKSGDSDLAKEPLIHKLIQALKKCSIIGDGHQKVEYYNLVDEIFVEEQFVNFFSNELAREAIIFKLSSSCNQEESIYFFFSDFRNKRAVKMRHMSNGEFDKNVISFFVKIVLEKGSIPKYSEYSKKIQNRHSILKDYVWDRMNLLVNDVDTIAKILQDYE